MEWQFIVIGLIIAALIAWSLVVENARIDKLKTTGLRTQGEVLKNSIKWGRNTVVRALIRFTTEDGQVIEAEDSGPAMIIPKYSKGQKVLLAYDRENPKNFTVITTGNWA